MNGHVIRANIARFEYLLGREQDPTRRAMISLLLEEERRKLEALQLGQALARESQGGEAREEPGSEPPS